MVGAEEGQNEADYRQLRAQQLSHSMPVNEDKEH